MLQQLILILGLLCVALGLPNPQTLLVPDLQVSPVEVNTLNHQKVHSRSIESSVGFKNNNNIEETIKEVESILKSNPALPRLTRGEILDLLDNITQTDVNKNIQSDQPRDPKAIMVVMPYTLTNNDDNVQDLYTKAPVTHIIGAEPFTTKLDNEVTNKPVFRRKTTSKPQVTTTSTTTEKVVTEKKVSQRKRKPETTTQVPEKKPSGTTLRSRGTPMRKRRPTQSVKHSNHKYPDEVVYKNGEAHKNHKYLITEEVPKKEAFIPSKGITIIKPPKFNLPQQINDDLLDLTVQEDNMNEYYYNKEKPVKQNDEGKQNEFYYTNEKFNNQKQGSASQIKFTTSTTQQPLIDSINIPQHLQGLVSNMNLAGAFDQDHDIITTKPNFEVPNVGTTSEDAERLKGLLAAMGIMPVPTTTELPDVKNVANNLSPDMKDLLMNFGLIPNPNDKLVPTSKPSKFYPEQAEINKESYQGFKPLPDDTSNRDEMQELLARFGLGRNSRKQKSIPKQTTNFKNPTELNFDMIPDHLKGVITDIGFGEREPKKIRTEGAKNNELSGKNKGYTTTEKVHVFNPSDKEYVSEEEIEKLNRLLESIKELEKLNGTATEEDLKNIDFDNIKDLVANLNQEQKHETLEKIKGPNPLDFDIGLTKNEVKRQQPTTTTTTTEAVVSTTSEEAQTSNTKLLEDSFGGPSESEPVTSPPEVASTTPRTGFYYLVDWNSFLDIDDQKGKRVNLRLQPKIGDPKRFYSVSVP